MIGIPSSSAAVWAYHQRPGTMPCQASSRVRSAVSPMRPSRDGFGYVISIATPLIFSALAVAVCFKGGMFNIGVEGQYLVGMVAAAWAALKLDFLPGPLLMWVTIAFGMLGAVAFASVPAVLKVKTGAHEVVTTIMMNGIAISFVAWAINGPLHFTQQLAGFNINLRTDLFKANARIPDLGHRFGVPESAHLSWLFPMALVTAAIVWFVLKRMRLGYEARAVGASVGSAQAGGISIGSVQIKLFILSGALAGLVGMQQLLADKGYLPVQYEAALGFTGAGFSPPSSFHVCCSSSAPSHPRTPKAPSAAPASS